jgi:hypothetical protein
MKESGPGQGRSTTRSFATPRVSLGLGPPLST